MLISLPQPALTTTPLPNGFNIIPLAMHYTNKLVPTATMQLQDKGLSNKDRGGGGCSIEGGIEVPWQHCILSTRVIVWKCIKVIARATQRRNRVCTTAPRRTVVEA
jgi:hypothetical protein